MIHTFTIDTTPAGAYRARCDTCGSQIHVTYGVRSRDLAVSDARQHARIMHGAKDVAGNDTAWERVMPQTEPREGIMNEPTTVAGQGIKCAPFDNSGFFACRAGVNGEARDAVHEWTHPTSGNHGFFCPRHSPFDYKPVTP